MRFFSLEFLPEPSLGQSSTARSQKPLYGSMVWHSLDGYSMGLTFFVLSLQVVIVGGDSSQLIQCREYLTPIYEIIIQSS